MDKQDQTVKRVAAAFGCSDQTVLNWIAAGKLRAYRLGGDGAYRVPWAEIERAKSEWTYRPDTGTAI